MAPESLLRRDDRSDATPAVVPLTIGSRVIQAPAWWAEANGYGPGDPVRDGDVARVEAVSAAARGALAAMDRTLAYRARPPRRSARRRARLSFGLAVAAASCAATLAALALAWLLIR